MEKEIFLSGYCRVLDSSRTVCIVVDNGKLTEADCNYEVCPYAANCPIGKSITEAINE